MLRQSSVSVCRRWERIHFKTHVDIAARRTGCDSDRKLIAARWSATSLAPGSRSATFPPILAQRLSPLLGWISLTSFPGLDDHACRRRSVDARRSEATAPTAVGCLTFGINASRFVLFAPAFPAARPDLEQVRPIRQRALAQGHGVIACRFDQRALQ